MSRNRPVNFGRPAFRSMKDNNPKTSKEYPDLAKASPNEPTGLMEQFAAHLLRLQSEAFEAGRSARCARGNELVPTHDFGTNAIQENFFGQEAGK